MRSSWYAALGLLLAVIWPLALTGKISDLAAGILAVLSLNAVIFTAFSTTSRHLSYFRGLDIIAASFMSGCVNFTLLYIGPVLIIIQLMALFYSVVAIFAGRQFSQHRWILLVNSFYERHAGRPLEAFEAIQYEHES